MTSATGFFMDVDHHQMCKAGNAVAGDVFTSGRAADDSIVTVLADGLGSGIKANVLATLTARMAAHFVMNDMDIRRSAEIIISTLPICAERKIGYSTFTVTRIARTGEVSLIEYDNPRFLLIRGGECVSLPYERIELAPDARPENFIRYYRFTMQYGDRLVLFSDGVTQSGMGQKRTPLGWGARAVEEYALETVRADAALSARRMARMIVTRAAAFDDYRPHDDITAQVVYCRAPRRLLIVTGPSLHAEQDAEMARIVDTFPGGKIICGGTTSMIISRELKREVTVDITRVRSDLPPCGAMEGIDLVTEGILTLCRVSELLDGTASAVGHDNAAGKLLEHLLNNDIIHFLVGTRINEAHQDPTMPQEIEIRRNIIKKIMKILEKKHLKNVSMQFI
jgi:hypothetical protein